MRQKHTKCSAEDALSALFVVSGEKKDGLGEDSYTLAANTQGNVLLSVFDGCGGSGAKVYETYSGHTGAYLASRIASGVAYDWFQREEPDDALENHLKNALAKYKEKSRSTSTIRSSMAKDFPTTASVMHCTLSDDSVRAVCLWCGDSRGFALTAKGLRQLTADDVQSTGTEPDMRSDGVMTSLCSASKPFSLHSRELYLPKQCILITATDGCFGYVPSPIHFEMLLLDTLLRSTSLEEWKNRIFQTLKEISADDYTMCVAAFGYDTFQDMQKQFVNRANQLLAQYIRPWENATEEQKQALWLTYAASYLDRQEG